MLSYIEGKVKNIGKDFLVLLVAGLGYKIYTGESLLRKVKTRENLELFLYDHVYDAGHDLFGFLTEEELNFFEELDSVNGVGPRSALLIVSKYRPDELKQSILRGETHLLTKISGIGKKTAGRIVLELKGKLAEGDERPYTETDEEVVSALASLGYSRKEVARALEGLELELSAEEKIKQALKNLGKK